MGDSNQRYTKIEDLMDLSDFFDEPANGMRNMGKGPNSMDGMPPNPNSIPFQQKLTEENLERQEKMNPIQGRIRKNVDMVKAMRGGGSQIEPQYIQSNHYIQANHPNHSHHSNHSNHSNNYVQSNQSNQYMSQNSGSIYPSNPNLYFAPENTNPSNYESNTQYKYGNRVYQALNKKNTYEGFDDYNKHMKNINCIDVANHIKSCPICSKFYENDKTIYVVAIIILLIICIILIKKVLENYEK